MILIIFIYFLHSCLQDELGEMHLFVAMSFYQLTNMTMVKHNKLE